MVLNSENINQFLNKYIDFVDNVSNKFNYDGNIKHLLYLIVPAFVAKYDLGYEQAILKCFENTKIYISGTEDNFVTATFNRELRFNGTNYYTDKYIILNRYKESNLTNLLDSIVHEFNHAVNSFNNEISYDDKYVKLRTGLCYLVYDRKNLRFLHKTQETALEEVINTEQTEDIINIINSFNNYNIDNIEFSNMVYALKNEIKSTAYVSNAYYFQSYICDVLMKNKTFAPTISNLRFKGFVDDIPSLFDNVLGKDGSYKRLASLLENIHSLELKYSKAKIFKKMVLNKIMAKAKEVSLLIQEYDSKCIYK